MKVVLDIETIQAPRADWARLLGKESPPEQSSSGHEALDLFEAGAAEEARHAED